MRTREEVIRYCLSFPDVYEDAPFHDDNWTVMRCRANKKVFAWIFGREGNIWVNVKMEPQWRDFWRDAFAAVRPAYHLNKEHWSSIILDGTVPDGDIKRMLGESFDLVKPKKKASRKGNGKEHDEKQGKAVKPVCKGLCGF